MGMEKPQVTDRLSPEVTATCEGGIESPVWALIDADTRRHAEQEWPGEGLNAVSRAVFIARGGHAANESCAIDTGLRYDDAGDWDEEMYMNEYREMLAAHYALPWWRRMFHRV